MSNSNTCDNFMPDYVPKDIPKDECRKFYDCELHTNVCPCYKDIYGTSDNAQIGVTSSSSGSAAANLSQQALDTLQQLTVCVEKFHSDAEDSVKNMSGSQYQQAAFLLSTLWEVKDTIRIAFLPVPLSYPGVQPQWDGGSITPPQNPSVVKIKSNVTQPCADRKDCGPNQYCDNRVCVTRDLMPQWYNRPTATSQTTDKLTPEEEEFERKIRKMDPIEAIKSIVREKIQPLIGLKLEFVDTGAASDIRISLDNTSGSWSLVGTQCRTAKEDEATMNFGWLDTATIIHEFCHALGMIHEHQNPFGKGISWNIPVLMKWASATQRWDFYTTCSNITKKYSVDSVNGSNYDPKSIMLYSYPPELTTNGVGTNRNIRLSEQDKLWLSNIYPIDTNKQRVFPSRNVETSSLETPKPSVTPPADNNNNIKNYYSAAQTTSIVQPSAEPPSKPKEETPSVEGRASGFGSSEDEETTKSETSGSKKPQIDKKTLLFGVGAVIVIGFLIWVVSKGRKEQYRSVHTY